jgi:nitrate reductase gamma subunit
MVLYLVTYASLVVFIVAVVAKFLRIQKFPLHVRWEIYPVPHEGKRALHGGSRLEETDWWTRQHAPDKGMELKFMLQEMVFIKALQENNPKLWRFSFPFHFGLYLLAAFAALTVLSALLGLAGVALPAAVGTALAALGVGAGLVTLFGVVGLLYLRLVDVDMKPYTNFGHFFNLLVIGATVGLIVALLVKADYSIAPLASYVVGMVTFQALGEAAPPLLAPTVLASSLLLAYIPLTHMSHFFVKWFTWHKIRWDDEPNVRGGRIEKMINKALGYPVTWSADHIRGDGKRTWADVATEEQKSE